MKGGSQSTPGNYTDYVRRKAGLPLLGEGDLDPKGERPKRASARLNHSHIGVRDDHGPPLFRLPDIGEGVVEGEVVEWFIAVGDAVVEDDPCSP